MIILPSETIWVIATSIRKTTSRTAQTSGRWQRRTGTHQNTLAALEAEENRAAVADHAEDGGQIRTADGVQRFCQAAPVPESSASKIAAQVDGGYALAHIADGGENSGQLAVGAQHVRHARVAAASDCAHHRCT